MQCENYIIPHDFYAKTSVKSMLLLSEMALRVVFTRYFLVMHYYLFEIILFYTNILKIFVKSIHSIFDLLYSKQVSLTEFLQKKMRWEKN